MKLLGHESVRWPKGAEAVPLICIKNIFEKSYATYA